MALVISDTPKTSKKEIFEDVDKAFKEPAVVICTSTLSVGIGIKDLSFGKLIMTTCWTRCMVQDNFQGILCFGHKLNLLNDEMFIVILICPHTFKQVNPRKTSKDALMEISHANKADLAQQYGEKSSLCLKANPWMTKDAGLEYHGTL